MASLVLWATSSVRASVGQIRSSSKPGNGKMERRDRRPMSMPFTVASATVRSTTLAASLTVSATESVTDFRVDGVVERKRMRPTGFELSVQREASRGRDVRNMRLAAIVTFRMMSACDSIKKVKVFGPEGKKVAEPHRSGGTMTSPLPLPVLRIPKQVVEITVRTNPISSEERYRTSYTGNWHGFIDIYI